MSKRPNREESEFRQVATSWAIEFGPIVAFFLTAEYFGVVNATGLFVFLTVVALLASYSRDRRVALFPLVAGLSVIIFGLLTVILHNPFFIIIKDTVYNGLFAVAIAMGLYVFKRPILKDLFSSLFHMTDRGWMILSRRWMIMFVLLTISNELVRHDLPPHAWVKYKMFATLATIVFGFYQITLSKRERMPDSNRWGMNVK
ncbi:MAG: septation protein IspZ [Candidatus Paceibacterota bacterium]|jgi:intracellular septation protein